ncbi:ABC-F family ATP-binding cassette domain-containing protein [Nocardia terpenica]|uniref:ABC-F family ATP-binding cassette domain-containing protein n=1 Tax=Nocardia terpenica TaxID=455432 RepID=UPI001892E9A6|nr:ATP-binding cassette domain-containing protein [Nocardia terpenica]MBF6060677.1 ABC-F family ATP-binding cassette domain-containing protein [Nocardia terpenica]MBF6103937.1 ABC-F family ATP-binding cassette domain-containing protein [Nocardia terpenica]MBF6111689.1 ABC-F family ATP-binding cassette domain-containing protein [Nocardia terpenica]MBF6118158.1 ABC-F family ATP-binding cassette domain-containing protein [Nocardia terpenica]MBF6156448.1 ABC-F family ATP-binding cassette domain-co
MAHIDIADLHYVLPDGRPLLGGVSFRIGAGVKAALIGPNGTGKTTLLRIIAGDLAADDGAVTRSGTLGVMRQFIGRVDDDSTVRDLLLDIAAAPIAAAARVLDAAENALIERDEEATQLAYAHALSDWVDVGGYEAEAFWDVVTTAVLGVGFDRAKWRSVRTLSGGEQKRLALEALFAGPDQLLLLDEPDNYLDVPGKQWLERTIAASDKSVLFVSHDRELIANAATRIVTLEPGAAGATAWIHGGGFASYHRAREDRTARLAELRRRWDEEHAKLRALVLRLREKAKFNDSVAARYHAAQTRLAKFEEAGPPEAIPLRQNVSMRLRGGRTGKRALVCTRLELTGLMRPFDAEIWYGDRVAVLGANSSGKSHFLRLLAAGGTDPDADHLPAPDLDPEPVPHTGRAALGARVRPGYFAQTHSRPDLSGRTLVEILHSGDDHRDGMGREDAGRILDRYGLARAAEQRYDDLSGGQQARLQILLLELSGVTMLLLDEPTDNLDLHSADALEQGIAGFAGTVVAVTHDRWFARGFDRFLVFGSDGTVYERDTPIWNETRISSTDPMARGQRR